MQINPLHAGLSVSSNLAADKVKALHQERNFEDKLKELTDAQKTADNAEKIKLRQVCKELESVFLGMLLKQMRSTVPKTGLMGGTSNAAEIYQSMMDDEMAKEMAQAGGIGLGEMLYRQLSPRENNITTSPLRRPITRQDGE